MNIRFVRFTIVLALSTTAILAQKTTLQLQDASGDRLIIETGTLTATRVATLPDASGMLMVGGSASLDDLLDAKSGGANFSNSLLLGHQTTGTLNNASSNTGVGYGVLQSITSANANTAMGLRALASLTSGAENSAFGHRAGESTTTAMMNTAIGEYAMRLNQTASEHTSVGAYSLYSMTTGQKNAVLGNGALYSLTSGSQNTVVGADAGSNMVSASGNVFIGYAAGQNETGSNKLYIDNSNTATPLIYGDFSSNYVTINSTLRLGEPLASGTNYTAFVAQAQASDITYTLPATAPTAGQALIAGSTPTTLEWGSGGARSLDELSDAKSGGANFTNSLLLGHENVASINDADQNVAIGGGVIQSITTGDYNTAMGYSALQSVTSGSQNVALGTLSMNQLTVATNNVAIGMMSMRGSNTTGSSNVAIGYQAGYDVDGTAQENTAVGARIFRNQLTGNRNTAVGADAMYNGGTGGNNVVIGYSAMSSITTGANNVVIGSQAGLLTQTGSGNVFIGHNAGWGETGSDKLYIDNSSTGSPLIYGDFSSNNLTVNGALTLMAATSDYNTVSVDAANLTNTYLAFGLAGAGSDWSYLRQIGSSDNYHVAWDFHDNSDDARFSIRSVGSSGATPDVITTRLSLDGAGNFLVSGHGTFKSHVVLQPSSSVEGGEVILQKASNAAVSWAIDQYEGDNEARLRFLPTSGGETFGMVIEENDGHIGIGTANPTARLELVSGGAFGVGDNPRSNNAAGISIRNSNNTNTAAHALLTLTTAGGGGGDAFITWDVTSLGGWSMGVDNSDNQKLKIYDLWGFNGNAFMTFDFDNQRIGFWDETPDYQIDIASTINQVMRMTTTNNDVTGMLVMNVQNAPVGGQNQEYIMFQTGGFTQGTIGYDGAAMYFAGLSDYRLKEDLQTFNALRLVDQIPVHDFKWKQSGLRMYGFMAHELQAVVPYLTIGAKDAVDDQGNPVYQMVDYSKLTPILTKAIQEQQAVIESQEQTINDLRSRVERMERALESLLQEKK